MTDSKKPPSTSAEREALMKEISAVAVAIGNVPAAKNRPMAKGAKLGSRWTWIHEGRAARAAKLRSRTSFS
jgi:hypothetical protein